KTKWPALHVTAAKAVIVIPGKTLDTSFLTWEGTVTERTGSGQWGTKTVPVHLTFETPATKGNDLEVWGDPAKRLKDGDTWTVDGVIDNIKSKATASDGSCLAALDSYGSADPFY